MNTETMKEFIDVYNAIKLLQEKSYLKQDDYYHKMEMFAYNICERMAMLVNGYDTEKVI